ncbi:uncharacterized protein si:ch73-193c12.2 [Hoplias malabaricus]|uniref:uncharacterized protein si:ch73-193c12.2 n=1 Tax=Hoplias malabaricus TaxID=27720 RepID=UPI0034628800
MHQPSPPEGDNAPSYSAGRGTDANTADLIVWSISNRSLFTGKRNTALRAFELFVNEQGLEGKVTPAWVKKKWENLRQKYKDLKGLSLMGGDPSAHFWKWYTVMDQAFGSEIPNVSSILCTPSASPVLVSSSPPIKRRKEQYFIAALQELERKQEEKENRRLRGKMREKDEPWRERRKERRAAEREKEREKQSLVREKRREQEMLARQERWEKEL